MTTARRTIALRGMDRRDTGQGYIDGLVLHYNYFRTHGGLDGKRPAEAAAVDAPLPWTRPLRRGRT